MRFVLDVEVDDALAAVHEVDVFGGHLQSARATHAHHVGAEVGEDHARVRARPDAAELDDPDPRQGSVTSHLSNVTQPSSDARYCRVRQYRHIAASRRREAIPLADWD